MTRRIEYPVTCPKCNHEDIFRIYESINSTLNPELVQELIDWELFKYTCPNCQESYFLQYGFLYHDMVHQTMIQFVTNKEEVESAVEWLENSLNVIGENEGTEPFSGYQIRVVSDIEDLVEKVQIAEAGYDDRIIEIMKFIQELDEEEDISLTYDHFVFSKVGLEKYQFFFINQNEAVASLDFSSELYERLEDEYADKLNIEYFIDSQWARKIISIE